MMFIKTIVALSLAAFALAAPVAQADVQGAVPALPPLPWPPIPGNF